MKEMLEYYRRQGAPAETACAAVERVEGQRLQRRFARQLGQRRISHTIANDQNILHGSVRFLYERFFRAPFTERR